MLILEKSKRQTTAPDTGGRLEPHVLAALRAHWTRMCDKRGTMPTREDFDPVSVPPLLANLWLFERLGLSGVYRVRLAGTAICEALGRELTGYRLDAFPLPGFGASLAMCIDGCIARGGPFRASFGPVVDARVPNPIGRCEHLAVPLAASMSYPQMALVASIFVLAPLL
jgi:hypothetical protein